MKRLSFLPLMAAYALASTAQITTTGQADLGYPSHNAISIPKEFCHTGMPLLTLYDNSDEENLLIYNEDLELIQTVKRGQEHTFDYRLTYQDEEREVEKVVISDEHEECLYLTFDEWTARQAATDPSFTASRLTITTESDGDSLITYDLSSNPYLPIEQLYFNYNYFGKQYPRLYWRCKNGQMYSCRASYSVAYTEWHTTGTHSENMQETLHALLLCNINLNHGDGRSDCYFEVSQTLFNDDDEFEYIIPRYAMSAKGSGNSDIHDEPYDPSGEETIELKRKIVISEQPFLALTGFQIVDTSGKTVKELLFDDGFEASISPHYAFVITIGTKTYLAFEGYKDEQRCTVFYLVDRSTNSIKKIETAPAQLSVTPIIAPKGTAINVYLDGNQAKNSEIIAYSATGAQIKRIAVPAGQASTQLSIATPGLYTIIQQQDNSIKASRKIILK
ncbi:MAG: hypothetical protein IJ196_00240 [Prevotella sp.]|nr:hypothetical protein [Prevotella sp.]